MVVRSRGALSSAQSRDTGASASAAASQSGSGRADNRSARRGGGAGKGAARARNSSGGSPQVDPVMPADPVADVEDPGDVVEDDGADDENAWGRRAQARLRQIHIGKARPEYRRYLSEVALQSRTQSQPSTPDPYERVSKRHFDRALGAWRRQLHDFDVPGQWAGASSLSRALDDDRDDRGDRSGTASTKERSEREAPSAPGAASAGAAKRKSGKSGSKSTTNGSALADIDESQEKRIPISLADGLGARTPPPKPKPSMQAVPSSNNLSECDVMAQAVPCTGWPWMQSACNWGMVETPQKQMMPMMMPSMVMDASCEQSVVDPATSMCFQQPAQSSFGTPRAMSRGVVALPEASPTRQRMEDTYMRGTPIVDTPERCYSVQATPSPSHYMNQQAHPLEECGMLQGPPPFSMMMPQDMCQNVPPLPMFGNGMSPRSAASAFLAAQQQSQQQQEDVEGKMQCQLAFSTFAPQFQTYAPGCIFPSGMLEDQDATVASSSAYTVHDSPYGRSG